MNRTDLISRVDVAISDCIKPLGFTHAEPDLWVREAGWRTDRVELVGRTGRKLTFFINLYVTLPPDPKSGCDFQSLAFVNLPATARHLYVAYYFADDHDRLLSRIREELTNVPGWFSQFETPAKCLDYLRTKGDKNPISSAYKYCEEYLSSLKVQ